MEIKKGMIYAGIGSRETPEVYLKAIRKIAKSFAGKGLTLRSGNARGADYAFYQGAVEKGGDMEIYLPRPI